MSRDSASLLDILKAGELALEFARGLNREQLEGDRMRQSAILYQIAIIGEATKRLSREFREQHPEVPWDDMAGMRDIIAHQYDRLDLDIVWQVIQRNIPEVLNAIGPLVPVQDPEERP
ncbi:MAG: HepT-like ribonuclease domain-containing protein [Planktothrix sp.]